MTKFRRMCRMGAISSIAALLSLLSCNNDDDEGVDREATCSLDLEISAHGSAEVTVSGVKIVGTIQVAEGVTVQAVYVAGQAVTQKEFNFRAWSVDIPQDVLVAYAQDGSAQLPVQAYTSLGCAELPEDEQPRVPIGEGGENGGAGGASFGGTGGA